MYGGGMKRSVGRGFGVGWFGFNPGSNRAGSDLRIGVIATNTVLAGAAGGVVAMIYPWSKYGKPDPGMMANGTPAVILNESAVTISRPVVMEEYV
jgi:hypothetical protein